MALQEEFKSQGDFLFRNRSYLPLIILVIGLGVFIRQEYVGRGEPESWFWDAFDYICLGISLMGLVIRILAVGYSHKNTSGRNTRDGQIADRLNITGLYSMVRHPLYLGNFIIWLGIAMLTRNIWFIVIFAFCFTMYYERIMFAEESYLRKKFGIQYLEWAQKVPAFLPSFRRYIKPETSFDIRKVIKKEKNGLTAIFILFWLFDVVGDIAEERSINIEFGFWLWAALVSLLAYFVLKILKKRRLI